MIDQRQRKPIMENAVGTAARRKSQMILGEMFWQVQCQRIRDQLSGDPVHVIDLRCGPGISSEGIWQMLPDGSKLTAFETDPVHLESVIQRIRPTSGSSEFVLLRENFIENHLAVGADIVVGASVLNDRVYNQKVIETVSRVLRPGGMLILNYVDFSQSHAYPASFAMAQYAEYVDQYQRKMEYDLTTAGLRELVGNGVLDVVSVETMAPRFLEAYQRELPSRILEYLSNELAQADISTPLELQAILTELLYLSRKSEVMISAPLIFQLCALRKYDSQ